MFKHTGDGVCAAFESPRAAVIVSLDEGTIAMLVDHLEAMDKRAAQCGAEIPDDGFVFSLDPSCIEPMRPDS